jgi:putative collagen-binding collagen-like cell surface-anchored protein fneC|nr:MAG TPA: nucleoid-associated protein [Caudoviricetes sp.]
MADNTLTLKIDRDTVFPLLEGLRGPKGEKGEDGQRGERGERGEQGPRGYKGEAGSAEKSAQFLKEHNIWLEDTSVDTLLMKVIELSGCHNNFTPKSLDFIQPKEGATYIDFTGEPHYKLAINNGEKREFQSDNMRVSIDESMKGNVRVDYYDLTDRLVTTHIIEIVKPTQGPDFGAFVKDTQLTSSMVGVTVAGTGKVYENGVKIIPTVLETMNKFNLENMFKGIIEKVCDYKQVECVELDLTKLPDTPAKGGNFPEVCKNLSYLVNSGNNTIVKVNRGQVITVSEDPMTPNKTGEATSIKFTGVENKKIQFNGSELVAMERGARYEYVFATDTINKLG